MSSKSSLNDKLPLLVKLRNLSADPNNQRFLVHEADCVPSLCVFLDSSALASCPEITLASLQTLSFLSSHPENKKALTRFPRLLTRLVKLSDVEGEGVSYSLQFQLKV